ncbi:HEAT repeat domain-containing protein [Actinoplanes sichuanensis]|uniref:HEAT repeat domain-containing protein n=1 Tax=Actinoplanes sichuanensis TaxID=512349 RepID=A0ABW4A4M8_9ACTN|nr:HEAT repeat domain-containing protein [Actinoplanes sichuanensis]
MLDAVLDGLAGNPALPRDLLRRMIRWRGGSRLALRADLTDEVVEEMLATGWVWFLTALAVDGSVASPVRLRLAGHPDQTVRACAASGPPDRAVFEILAADPDQEVRVRLAENRSLPPDLRARLADDPDPEVRRALARGWTDLPEAVRRRLLTDRDEAVRAAACFTYHPEVPADLVPTLLADPATRAGVVRHLTLTTESAARLAEDRDYAVRRELARHPGLPADMRDRLASDDSTTVQVAVFAREDTPEPLRALIHDEVRGRSPSLVVAVDDPDPDDLGEWDDLAFKQLVEDRATVARFDRLPLPWVTADPMRHAGSPYTSFRLAVAAAAASLPPAVVDRLLADEEPRVAEAVVEHAPHRVDEATAERIERAYRPPARARARRPTGRYPYQPETLRRFATDPDPRMRVFGFRDPALPADILSTSAADPDGNVRRSAAAHRRMPATVLVAMLDDPDERVARAAAGNPGLPVETMAELLRRAGL